MTNVAIARPMSVCAPTAAHAKRVRWLRAVVVDNDCLLNCLPTCERVRWLGLFRLVFRTSVLLSFLMPAPSAAADEVSRPPLSVGSGAGQVGLSMAPNEECHGPVAVTPAAGAGLALLDQINHKILVLEGDAARDIALPEDLLEPSDFIATNRGYLVVGALGDVVMVNNKGSVLARTRTAHDPEKGAVRLIAHADGTFALEDLRRKRIPVALSMAQTGQLITPGLAVASTYTRSQTDTNRSTLQTNAIRGPLSSISLTSAIRITDARVLWADPSKGAIVAVQESRRLPEEAVFVRLVNVDQNGKPTAESYIAPEAYACDAVRPYARLSDGRVVSLAFDPASLAIVTLRFAPLGKSEPRSLGARGEATLISDTENELIALERLNGTTTTSNISLTPISVERILARARAPLKLRWRLDSSSYSHSGVPNRCAPPSDIWRRPKRLDGLRDREVTAVPYRWGGYMGSIRTFAANLKKGMLAGDDCTCRKANCVYPQATGMDCSGFVSYAWQTDRYFTTGSLPQPRVSRKIRWNELAPGDIVNKAGSHVRLVESIDDLIEGRIVNTIESAANASCGGVCRRSYLQSTLQLSGYKPLRRRDLTEPQ